MKKSDWIDYFEALNGRTPSELEIAQALVNGEFQVEAEQVVTPVQPLPEVREETAQVAPVAPAAQAPVQDTPTKAESTPQAATSESLLPPAAAQYVENTLAASPAFFQQFWQWLVGALKAPMADKMSNKYNGVTLIGCLTLFYTILLFTIARRAYNYGASGWNNFMSFVSGESSYSSNPVGIAAFFAILFGVAFILFSIIFAGFIVKRFIYQETQLTLVKTFERYGRLLSVNLFIVGLVAILTIFGVDSLSGFLMTISTLLFFAATTFALARIENTSKMDDFHRYLLASVVNAVIVFFFLYVGMSIAGEYLGPLFGNFFFGNLPF